MSPTVATPAAASSWPWWRRSETTRRLGASLLTGLLVALITGSQGTSDDPTYALRSALLRPRVLPFLALGLLLFGLLELHARSAERLARMRGTLRAVGRPLARLPFRAAAGLLVLIAAVSYPPLLSSFWQTVLVDQIGIYVLLAIGLNVVVGFAGLLDLGYIAFFAIGAYTTAYFTGFPRAGQGISPLPIHPPIHLSPFEVLPIAVIACLLAGVVLGAPTLRLRGDYLAIVTLGFGEIVRIVAVNADSFTNGPRGAFGIPHPSFHLGSVGYAWTLDLLPYYYLLLGFVVVVVFLFRRLEDSRVGRAWTAIREDEVAAAASGVATVRYKLLAFSLGASTAGFAGVIYASKVGFIAPDNFPLLYSLLVLVFVIFGGMGSLPGVVIGAIVLQWLPQVLRDYVPPLDRFMYVGALLVIMMIFRPQGILPSRRRARELGLAEAGIGDADAMSELAGGAVR